MNKEFYYFAYGMNTNLDSMDLRCPGARPMGYATLPGYEFRFATHADIVPKLDSYVDGVLWVINFTHLESLDALEGFPSYYNRIELPVYFEGRTFEATTYFMQPGMKDEPPAKGYWDMVIEGYHENGVPTTQLYEAFNKSIDQKIQYIV